MQAIVLSIGDELVGGLTTNTNAPWLSDQLAAVGVETRSHLTVGDRLPAIVSAIRAACESLELEPGGILLVSGGLGPTADDLTRQALADALQQELVEDPDAVLQIERWFAARKRIMSASNRTQALRPHSARILENRVGTAPGLHARHGTTDIFVMPGVPVEMKDMFHHAILPALRQKSLAQTDPQIRLTARINTFGLPESIIGERIKDLMDRNANPSVGTTVHDAVVSVRIYALGSQSQAAALLKETRQKILARLGPAVFSQDDEPLEAVLAQLLKEKKLTITTAESCTGGLLAMLLTQTPGSSTYFHRGWITYANAAKQDELAVDPALLATHGAVSQPVALAMAQGARRAANADWALATTGIAGPDGGSQEKPVGTVWIALAGPQTAQAHRFIFPGDRPTIRLRAAQMALALLRWQLLGLPPPA